MIRITISHLELPSAASYAIQVRPLGQPPRWWKDPAILSWISIALLLIATFLGLYFQSPRFAEGVHRMLVRTRLFAARNRVRIAIFLAISAGFILAYLGAYNIVIVTYAVLMSYVVFAERTHPRVTPPLGHCLLGDPDSESGQKGLSYTMWEDGNCVRELFRSEYIRRTDHHSGQNYMYFALADEARRALGSVAFVIIEYFDSPEFGSFYLQYDSTDKSDSNPSFKVSKPIRFSGSNEWQVAAFKLNDARFSKAQQGRADFRFRCGSISSTESPRGRAELIDLHVRSVTVASI